MPEQLDLRYAAWITQYEHFQLLLSIGRITFYFIRVLQLEEEAGRAFIDGDKVLLDALFKERNLLTRHAALYDEHIQRLMRDRLN